MKHLTENPQEVVKEMLWLAFEASHGPLGMGVFGDRPGATRDDVWESVQGQRNYPGMVSGDYVFGRMVKLRLQVDRHSVSWPEEAPREDYQAWCGKYRTYECLYATAKAAVDKAREHSDGH